MDVYNLLLQEIYDQQLEQSGFMSEEIAHVWLKVHEIKDAQS